MLPERLTIVLRPTAACADPTTYELGYMNPNTGAVEAIIPHPVVAACAAGLPPLSGVFVQEIDL